MTEIKLFKSRDGCYDLFCDGKWRKTSNSAENIFEYLSEIKDCLNFYYCDMATI